MDKEQNGLGDPQFAWRLSKKSCSAIVGCLSLISACLAIFIFFSGYQDVWEFFHFQNGVSPRLSVEVVRFVGDVYIVENGEKRLLLSGENAREAMISADEKRVAVIGTIPNTLTRVIHILDVDGNNHRKFLFDCTISASADIAYLSWPDHNKVRAYFECKDYAGEDIAATIGNFPITVSGYYDLYLDEHNGLLEVQSFPY